MIKRVLLAFYRFLQRFRAIVVWRFETKRERKKILHNSIIKELPPGKSLVLIPHSDDEWIGCSQVLIRFSQVLLCNMNMLGGDTDNLHQERLEEMKQIARITNHNLVTLSESYTLESIIENYKPDYIFIPNMIDWHPEHLAVVERLIKTNIVTSEISPKIICYQVSVPLFSKAITHYLEMNKHAWKGKWKTFRDVYETQKFLFYERFALNERINGALINDYACEVFVMFENMKLFKDAHLRYKLTEDEQLSLKQNLASITGVRNFVNRLFCQ